MTPMTLLPRAWGFAWLSRLEAVMTELRVGAVECLRMYKAHGVHFSEFTSLEADSAFEDKANST